MIPVKLGDNNQSHSALALSCPTQCVLTATHLAFGDKVRTASTAFDGCLLLQSIK